MLFRHYAQTFARFIRGLAPFLGDDVVVELSDDDVADDDMFWLLFTRGILLFLLKGFVFRKSVVTRGSSFLVEQTKCAARSGTFLREGVHFYSDFSFTTLLVSNIIKVITYMYFPRIVLLPRAAAAAGGPVAMACRPVHSLPDPGV